MGDTERARAALGAGKTAEFIRALVRAAKAREDGVAALAREVLETGPVDLADIAAQALGKVGDPGAGPAIRAALLRPGTGPVSYRLLSVLRGMRVPLGLEEAVAVAEHGTNEACLELTTMLGEGLIDAAPGAPALEARLAAVAARDEDGGWAAEAILLHRERIAGRVPGKA